jgi:hemolysin activation/secretion protein
LEENSRAFLNMKADAKIVFPVTKGLIFAHRTGGATNVGDFEFYQSNTVGGLELMRGYWRSRFSGKTSFYQNTELRLQLASLKGYVFRGIIGVYGFFDDGRVWVKNDSSHTLHTSYGGGIYFIPFNIVALNLTYGISKEASVFTVRTGFLF